MRTLLSKESGFWNEVLRYLESKTKATGFQTYDMVKGKWKMVCPNMARFCGVQVNMMHRVSLSGAEDEDYFTKALLDYEAEYGVLFTL
ncbi:hypothetical protein Tco_1355944, partial [Tanacetum coccineum]